MKVSGHKDNAGVFILARTFLTKFTPLSKHYVTMTIWFCENINKQKIALLKIATTEQLGYILTKGVPISTFEYLRNKIMG